MCMYASVVCVKDHWMTISMTIKGLKYIMSALGRCICPQMVDLAVSTFAVIGTVCVHVSFVHVSYMFMNTFQSIHCPLHWMAFESCVGICLWHCGTVALWHCGPVALWHCGPVALWHCGTVALWHCGTVALWHCGTVVLWPCGTVALWPVALWSCGPVVLWHCGPVALWPCGTVALWR